MMSNRPKQRRPVITSLLVVGQLWLAVLLNHMPNAQANTDTQHKLAQARIRPAPATSGAAQYYYTRTRSHPSHLRVSEEAKNRYVDDVKYESIVNGTRYEYFRSYHLMSYDELIYETIDKMFRHRLSAFYIHHYDRDEDKRRSSDPQRASPSSCARDLLYLVEKLPKQSLYKNPFAGLEDDQEKQRSSGQDEPLTPELTAFFDSYARQEAGLLRGNTYWTGSYDQCVTRHIFDLIDPEPETDLKRPHDHARTKHQSSARRQRQDKGQQIVSFKGRYCVASLKSPHWDKMIENKKRMARQYFKTEQQVRDYHKLFRLQLGICLPDSCDSSAMDRHLDEIKMLAKSTLEPRLASYDLIDLYCLPDETSPLRQWSSSALGFIAFTTLWLAAVLYATLADLLEIFGGDLEREASGSNEKRRSRGVCMFVDAFSLRANYRKLMRVSGGGGGGGGDDGGDESADSKPGRKNDRAAGNGEMVAAGGLPASKRAELQIDLRFLNAFKAIIMFWIINGHIMLLMIQTAKNILDSDALLNGLMHTLIGATFGVDLFFTMTGFLTAYLLFNSGHAFKMRPGTWVYLSFHRYWRLAPMYLLAFWFSRSVMQLLGNGPLWDYGTSNLTFRGLCNSESWWFPLTLTSNLHGLFEECMITSWYISCDMQFWLASPVFIYLLAKSPISGWLVALATILGSSKLRYDAMLHDKSARYDELVQPRADIFMRVSHDLPALYTHPHYRISAYLVGLLAGHYVYMIKSGKWRSSLADDLVEEQKLESANEDVKTKCGGVSNKTIETTKTTTTMATDEIKTKSSSFEAGFSNGVSGSKTPDQNLETKTANDESIGLLAGAKTRNGFKKKRESDLVHGGATERAERSRNARNNLAHGGLVLFLLMTACSYLLNNYFPTRYLKHSRSIAAVLYAFDHMAMSLGVSLIIVTMCFGQWRRATHFLSHPNWTRLSKINYALLLLQCESIYFQIFRYDQVPMAGTRELINILFNLLVTLYPLAFAATLTLEFPLANLEKFVMGALVGAK